MCEKFKRTYYRLVWTSTRCSRTWSTTRRFSTKPYKKSSVFFFYILKSVLESFPYGQERRHATIFELERQSTDLFGVFQHILSGSANLAGNDLLRGVSQTIFAKFATGRALVGGRPSPPRFSSLLFRIFFKTHLINSPFSSLSKVLLFS